MPSKIKEHYLKAIFFLDHKGEEVTVTALGSIMGVSKPTVNNMVKKLKALGWVIYEKYQPLQLTLEGKYAASQIVRKHRLTEMYLVEVMGFGWEEVHQIAEEIEHVKEEKLFDRMDEMLGYPTHDPHGSPIPDAQGNISKRELSKLSSCAVDQLVIVQAISEENNDFLLLLNELSIGIGTEITLQKIQQFDKSLMVTYNDKTSVFLTHEVASRLLVEVNA